MTCLQGLILCVILLLSEDIDLVDGGNTNVQLIENGSIEMKRIDELALLEDQFSKEQKKATLIMLIIQAIENVEKLIEGNPEFIDSPMSYNLVGGIIDQLKANVPAIYKPAEYSLLEQVKCGDGQPSQPLFGGKYGN